MIIPFNKYQGTGNDFIIIDNRQGIFNPYDTVLIRKLCNRRFGIGADGLILISAGGEYDYRMRYFNSDGNESTLCGNGGRCAAAFASRSGIAGTGQLFMASDGIHEALLDRGIVKLKMNDVTGYTLIDGNYFMDTGSPHYVVFLNNIEALNVYDEGKKLRWSDKFSPGGTNVNFAEIIDGKLFVRTFERGVEDETLSCGTGVTASAIASVLSGHFDTRKVNVLTRGGELSVEFTAGENRISDIWLIGPATFVFEGVMEV